MALPSILNSPVPKLLVISVILVVSVESQLELCKNFVTTLDFDTLTIGDKKMVYFAQEKTWQEAYDQCQRIGMRLVSIETEEENKALFTFLHNRVWGANQTALDYTYWYMWSSGSDADVEGTWRWKSTGDELKFTSWTEGEPNGGSGENCVELRFISWDKLFWNDSICSIRKRYICETVQSQKLSFEK